MLCPSEFLGYSGSDSRFASWADVNKEFKDQRYQSDQLSQWKTIVKQMNFTNASECTLLLVCNPPFLSCCLHRWLPTWVTWREARRVCTWFYKRLESIVPLLISSNYDSLCSFVYVTEFILYFPSYPSSWEVWAITSQPPCSQSWIVLDCNLLFFFYFEVLVVHGYTDKYKIVLNHWQW